MNQRFRKVLATHRNASSLTPSDTVYRKSVLRCLLDTFLADTAAGDITTRAILPSPTNVTALLVAKQPGVLAGMQELLFFLGKRWARTATHMKLFGTVTVLHSLKDGAALKKGTVIAKIRGNVSDILKLERTVLNFLQHMSGVATSAAMFVNKAGGDVLVCPTRKTSWGLPDKRACVVGGAGTHRLHLGDALLIKDTHLDLLSHDFDKIYRRLLKASALGRFVEIEVESLKDARSAAEILIRLQRIRPVPSFVMFDNMKPSDIALFVRELRGSAKYRGIFTEASGGINLLNIRAYARTGVDVLSVGAMTHSAPALDISLKISSGL